MACQSRKLCYNIKVKEILYHGYGMAKGEYMKANIHPESKEAVVTCACGATFTTHSTKDKIDVEICSECHPFYTGQQGRAKKTGNIEKFNKKFGLNQEQK